MLLTYIKIAWRNIRRHRLYSLVNILGLALGICACLTLYLIVSYEFSFDRFLPQRNRIYRIVGERINRRGEKDFVNSVYDDVAAFETQIPGFAIKTGFHNFGDNIAVPDAKGGLTNFENHIPHSYSQTAILAHPSYFDIFPHTWLAGDARALDQPFRVVLTESRARLYFGNHTPVEMLGRQVVYGDSIKAFVGGIVADWSHHSDFAFTDFLSYSTATHSYLQQRIPTDDWRSLEPHNSQAFVMLDKGVTPEQIDARFDEFVKTHLHYKYGSVKMYLQPLTSAHFAEWFHVEDDGDNWRKPYLPTLYVLMGVAVFILLLACINFINLSTAQSIQRAREVGVRKILGSRRANIVGQFLIETLMLTLIAALASMALVRPVLRLFKDYVPNGVEYHPFSGLSLLLIAAVVVLTTLLAGLYPARVLASYLPALTLKGIAQKPRSTLRRGLIVFQFVVSLVFIIGSIVIGKQIRYMRTTDKGFNTDAVITLNHWGPPPQDKLRVLAQQLKTIPGVEKVLLQSHAPMGFAQMTSSFFHVAKDTAQVEATVEIGNEEFVPFYQLRLVAGRNMLHSDSAHEVVINETMARTLGFSTPQEAIGQPVSGYGRNGAEQLAIAGVVADFHMESFHNAIKPAVIVNWPDFIEGLAVRLSPAVKTPAQVKAVLAGMETAWKTVYPDQPFNYSFLNESITWLFAQEQNTAWLATVAMIITIFISCMGLFGLAMFSAERRVKEIGIRKVMGARVGQIVLLLNRDFIALVCLALLIASPLAWYFAHQWLQDFVYRTSISWWIFILAGAGALCIALATVSYQAVRAALANPVDSLRNE
ncbi:MAG TPA: FtsX-like permease family protein [Puia sp.]|nr:FtsX-like permease family protein [Puia sp.]